MSVIKDSHALSTGEEPSFVFRAGIFEYMLIGIPALICFLFIVAHPDIQGFLLLVGAAGFLFYWRFTYEFKVTPLGVLKRANFQEQWIPFSGLAQVVISTGGTPPYALIFIPKSESGLKPLIVNIKPMRRKDLQKLAVFLPKIAPGVEYDSRFLLMADGKMPSMFFSHQ